MQLHNHAPSSPAAIDKTPRAPVPDAVLTPGVAAPLTPAQRHELLYTLNATRADYPKELGIHEMFEAQVRATPQHVALVFDGEQLSYAVLNARANWLARHLRAQGVTRDSVVGLYLERGMPVMLAILAILKAGGAYLPLDPAYPEARLRYMVENSALTLILSQPTLRPAAERLAGAGRSVDVLSLDSDAIAAASAGQDNADLPSLVGQSSADLAYVIYTSGSTGLPKGVMIAHQGAVNLALSQQSLFGVQADSRVIGFASFSFDAACSEWLMALLKGATLLICGDGERRDPAMLEAFLVHQKITHATLPPALLVHLSVRRPYCLQSLILAGEACPWPLVQPWLARYRVFNAYGPTETTVCASAAELRAGGPISIGRPIANFQLYVLDATHELVARGEPGELYIGGDGLARGYLNRPDLTAERFVVNPFHEPGDGVSGARLYRSGDLVRYLADGNLEYLGRIDDQVKIRGFRIELGEIDSQLLRHPALASAAVLARSDGAGAQQLVAYFTTSETAEDGARARSDVALIALLKAHLHAALPAYMVPALFVRLDAFPLTPNGKIDKPALPAPDVTLLQGDWQAPTTETERELVTVWAALLGVRAEAIGASANFFALGGDSLSLIALCAALRARFGKPVRPADVFAGADVGALAARIDALPAHAHDDMPRVGEHSSYAVSSKQKMDWMSNQISRAKNFPSLCCQLTLEIADIDAALLERTLQILLDRHEILRTRIAVVDGELRQTVCAQITFAALGGVHDLREVGDAEAAFEAITRTENSRLFDFATLPLFSAQLVRMAPADRLLFTVDHVCGDQRFFDVFLREAGSVYAALQAGRAPALAPIALDYKSYAQWEHAQLHGEQGEAHRAYWHGLIGTDPYPPLSRAFSDADVAVLASYRATIAQQIGQLGADLAPLFYTDVYGAVVNAYAAPQQTARYLFPIDAQLLGALQASGARSNAWLSSVMIAGLHILLHKLTGRERVLIGIVADGRDSEALQALGGCLINDIFSVGQISAGMRGDQVIAGVQRQMQESAQHKIYPFARLLSELDLSLDGLGLLELNYVSAPADVAMPTLNAHHKAGGFGAMDLNIAMTSYTNGIAVECNYKCALFEASTIEALMAYYVDILRQLGSTPHSDIAAIGASAWRARARPGAAPPQLRPAMAA